MDELRGGDEKPWGIVVAQSDFLLGENSAISEFRSSVDISELTRSPISYSIHYLVTAEDEFIAFDNTISFSVNLISHEIIQIANDDDP